MQCSARELNGMGTGRDGDGPHRNCEWKLLGTVQCSAVQYRIMHNVKRREGCGAAREAECPRRGESITACPILWTTRCTHPISGEPERAVRPVAPFSSVLFSAASYCIVLYFVRLHDFVPYRTAQQ